MNHETYTMAAWSLFLSICALSLLVVWLGPTWAKHYTQFRREGFGKGTSACYALSLTIVPLPKIDDINRL